MWECLLSGFSFLLVFDWHSIWLLQINKDLSYVKRFNAQEALEYGLIDRILRPARIKADAPRKETAQQGQA